MAAVNGRERNTIGKSNSRDSKVFVGEMLKISRPISREIDFDPPYSFVVGGKSGSYSENRSAESLFVEYFGGTNRTLQLSTINCRRFSQKCRRNSPVTAVRFPGFRSPNPIAKLHFRKAKSVTNGGLLPLQLSLAPGKLEFLSCRFRWTSEGWPQHAHLYQPRISSNLQWRHTSRFPASRNFGCHRSWIATIPSSHGSWCRGPKQEQAFLHHDLQLGCSKSARLRSFDMKPNAPAEIRGPFQPISTKGNFKSRRSYRNTQPSLTSFHWFVPASIAGLPCTMQAGKSCRPADSFKVASTRLTQVPWPVIFSDVAPTFHRMWCFPKRWDAAVATF